MPGLRARSGCDSCKKRRIKCDEGTPVCGQCSSRRLICFTPSRSNLSTANKRTKEYRSRSGCITCRKRRKKCTEERPICKACQRLGQQCVWQGSSRDDNNDQNLIHLSSPVSAVVEAVRPELFMEYDRTRPSTSILDMVNPCLQPICIAYPYLILVVLLIVSPDGVAATRALPHYLHAMLDIKRDLECSKIQDPEKWVNSTLQSFSLYKFCVNPDGDHSWQHLLLVSLVLEQRMPSLKSAIQVEEYIDHTLMVATIHESCAQTLLSHRFLFDNLKVDGIGDNVHVMSKLDYCRKLYQIFAFALIIPSQRLSPQDILTQYDQLVSNLKGWRPEATDDISLYRFGWIFHKAITILVLTRRWLHDDSKGIYPGSVIESFINEAFSMIGCLSIKEIQEYKYEWLLYIFGFSTMAQMSRKQVLEYLNLCPNSTSRQNYVNDIIQHLNIVWKGEP